MWPLCHTPGPFLLVCYLWQSRYSVFPIFLNRKMRTLNFTDISSFLGQLCGPEQDTHFCFCRLLWLWSYTHVSHRSFLHHLTVSTILDNNNNNNNNFYNFVWEEGHRRRVRQIFVWPKTQCQDSWEVLHPFTKQLASRGRAVDLM